MSVIATGIEPHGVTRIFFVEIHDIEIQVVNGVEIYGDPSPLVCAEKQFMENDDR